MDIKKAIEQTEKYYTDELYNELLERCYSSIKLASKYGRFSTTISITNCMHKASKFDEYIIQEIINDGFYVKVNNCDNDSFILIKWEN